MTPKEKAEELLKDYDILLISYISKTSDRNYIVHRCAQKALDNMLDIACYSDDDTYDYFLEVRQELEKL
jgi:hypothetical protein